MQNFLHRFRSHAKPLFAATTVATLSSGGLSAATESTDEALPVYRMQDFVVSAGPGLRPVSEFASPVNLLTEETLRREGGATLGESLDWQPGVSSSAFAAGASRPIIRGFDGPRVRILDSGIEAIDVSDTSPDHGVAVEPLLARRVEVIRGPSTLLYGSSAIGGVVNVIGREIPREKTPDFVNGAGELRFDSVSDGKTAVGYASAGEGPLVVTATGSRRKTSNYKIPGTAVIGEPAPADGRLPGSFVESETGSIGASWFFTETVRVGASGSKYNSNYGVPNDEGEEIAIDLRRDRFDADFEATEIDGFFEAVRARFGYTDYIHRELEDGDVGTTFTRLGWEARLEGGHAELGPIDEGVVGVQVSDTDFAAIGDEAFTPASTTRTQAVFVSEHLHRGRWHFEAGGRIERQAVDVVTAQPDYGDTAFSLAFSTIFDLAENQSLALVLQRSQRHPTSTELYADGPHLATQQYEIGDPDLEIETAYGADLTYRAEAGPVVVAVSGFYNWFDDYIYAENLGFQTDNLDTYAFTGVEAQFFGGEAEIGYTAYEAGDTRLLLTLMSDYVHATNLDSDEPLPRIPPFRVGAGADLEFGIWSTGVQIRQAFDQTRNAPDETDTSGYTLLNADAGVTLAAGDRATFELFVRASNLLDQDIRNSTSFLKDVAPLPGRNVTFGVRGSF